MSGSGASFSAGLLDNAFNVPSYQQTNTYQLPGAIQHAEKSID